MSVPFQRSLVVTTMSVVSLCAMASPQYKIIDLGMLPGGTSASGLAINSLGNVAGQCVFPQGNSYLEHAVSFSNGHVTDLAAQFPYQQSKGMAISNSGDVLVEFGTVAYLVRNGQTVDINTIPDTFWSTGYGVNSSGTCVGTVYVQTGPNEFHYHAFKYQGGQMVDLNSTFGGDYSEAYAVNDNGQMVGLARNAAMEWTAYRLQGGIPTYITGFTSSATMPYALSSNGIVAGASYLADGTPRAFIWTGGAIRDLGLLPGTTMSQAFGVNSSGTVVGASLTPGWGSNSAPFIWRNGTMINANTLLPSGSGWVLRDLNGINDAGEIVGTGSHNGVKSAFKLIPPRTTGGIAVGN